MMKIEIKAYWDAKIHSIQGKGKLTPEETIKNQGNIYICDVVIDKKFVGTVVWDGKKLSAKTEKKEK